MEVSKPPDMRLSRVESVEWVQSGIARVNKCIIIAAAGIQIHMCTTAPLALKNLAVCKPVRPQSVVTCLHDSSAGTMLMSVFNRAGLPWQVVGLRSTLVVLTTSRS